MMLSPNGVTSRISTPSVGSARSALADPTTRKPPRPVCPTQAPTGRAITSAMIIASAT
jgi:hypothetical protein